MDVNPDLLRVATGEVGPKPYIYVWDSNTLMELCKFRGALTCGIAIINFTPNGDKLAAAAIDNNHTIAIFDITSKSKNGGVMIVADKGGMEIIFDLKWKNEKEFVTVGIKHFKVWKVSNTGIKPKRGK